MKEQTRLIGKKQNRLFSEMENRYEQDHVKAEENERLRKLEEFRQGRVMPLQHDQIREQALKYEKLMQSQKEELRKKRGLENISDEGKKQQKGF